LAVATRVANFVSAARFPNQYFVGCASSFLPFVLGPFDQQPLLRQRFAALEIPVRRPHPHRRKTGLQLLFRALAPKDGLPSRGGEFRRKILGENRLVVRRTLASTVPPPSVTTVGAVSTSVWLRWAKAPRQIFPK
jgi:hypothetical protein